MSKITEIIGKLIDDFIVEGNVPRHGISYYEGIDNLAQQILSSLWISVEDGVPEEGAIIRMWCMDKPNYFFREHHGCYHDGKFYFRCNGKIARYITRYQPVTPPENNGDNHRSNR